MTQEQAKIVWEMYCSLSTTQIELQIRNGAFTREEWKQFVEDLVNAKA